jgi:phage-related protein
MMNWSLELIDGRVQAELNALPADMRARYVWISDLLTQWGPFRVRMPYVRPLQEGLWEMRLTGRSGIARVIFVLASGKRLVALHAFIKKTHKTPARAMAIARQRAKEVPS